MLLAVVMIFFQICHLFQSDVACGNPIPYMANKCHISYNLQGKTTKKNCRIMISKQSNSAHLR